MKRTDEMKGKAFQIGRDDDRTKIILFASFDLTGTYQPPNDVDMLHLGFGHLPEKFGGGFLVAAATKRQNTRDTPGPALLPMPMSRLREMTTPSNIWKGHLRRLGLTLERYKELVEQAAALI